MTSPGQELVPAYLSFTTFRTAVQDLRSHGLPSKLDKSAWSSRSGADQSQIWSAFRFLGFVSDTGVTQPPLVALVNCPENSDEEKRVLLEILNTRYSRIFALDLTTSTPNQLASAIEGYGGKGVTKMRAVRFFLKAAGFVGVDLSSRLTRTLRNRTPTTNGQDVVDDSLVQPKPQARPRKKKRPAASIATSDGGSVQQDSSGAAVKSITLRNAGGSLTISGTFNPFSLSGDERGLIYKIIDLMTEYDIGEKGAS